MLGLCLCLLDKAVGWVCVQPLCKLCFLLSVQKVAYKSKRWIYDLRTIAEVEGSGVKAWKHAEWKEQILVPALPQSILQGCSLIHIDYYIQVSLSGVSLGWAKVRETL